jgi:hypothetical protein
MLATNWDEFGNKDGQLVAEGYCEAGKREQDLIGAKLLGHHQTQLMRNLVLIIFSTLILHQLNLTSDIYARC